MLTHAGKPVFTSVKGDDESDEVSNMVGVMHALISVFADEQDKLRCEYNLPVVVVLHLIHIQLHQRASAADHLCPAFPALLRLRLVDIRT